MRHFLSSMQTSAHVSSSSSYRSQWNGFQTYSDKYLLYFFSPNLTIGIIQSIFALSTGVSVFSRKGMSNYPENAMLKASYFKKKLFLLCLLPLAVLPLCRDLDKPKKQFEKVGCDSVKDAFKFLSAPNRNMQIQNTEYITTLNKRICGSQDECGLMSSCRRKKKSICCRGMCKKKEKLQCLIFNTVWRR